MKKIAFTLQVVALIAMFPLYFVAELNHATPKFPVKNNTAGDIQVEVTNIPTVSSAVSTGLTNPQTGISTIKGFN